MYAWVCDPYSIYVERGYPDSQLYMVQNFTKVHHEVQY